VLRSDAGASVGWDAERGGVECDVGAGAGAAFGRVMQPDVRALALPFFTSNAAKMIIGVGSCGWVYMGVCGWGMGVCVVLFNEKSIRLIMKYIFFIYLRT
jgi:hypothetical protein